MNTIFVDNHLLVVNKPAGIPTQEAPGNADNLTDLAKSWIKQKYHKPGAVFLEPIHRLDKPVSGLVVFARTSKALSRLQEMMRSRTMKKWYEALVEHIPDVSEGRLEHYLVHDDYRARIVSSTHPEGKQALLAYRCIESTPRATLLEIELITGRYHQIRAQLSHIGLPILGDRKYGSLVSWTRESIALHHGKITLAHPVTREEFTWVVPRPFLYRVRPSA